MTTRQLTPATLAEQGFTRVRLEASNLDGIPLGKYLPAAKLASIAERGTPVSDVAFAFDVTGEVAFGWNWGEIRDIALRPDLATLAPAPQLEGLASVICDFVDVDGNPLAICPRGRLKAMQERLAERGLQALVAIEIEFTLFREDRDEARRRGFADLTPLGGPGRITYMIGRSRELTLFMDALTRRLEALGITWEGWCTETAAGQVEMNIVPGDPVKAADDVMRTKLAIREVADEMGHSVTFMAKVDDEQFGAGLHVNHSLSRDGESAFFDGAAAGGRSELMNHWIAGLMRTMPAAMSLLSPSVNSYRRLIDVTGPPTTVTWAEDNKTVAVRSIARDPKTTRAEHRVPSADANIYLALAAILAGGLAGLEAPADPPDPFEGMAWCLPEGTAQRLPGSITEACDELARDEELTPLLGKRFVDHWLATRRWEWLTFHDTGGDPASINEVERRRYFEVI